MFGGKIGKEMFIAHKIGMLALGGFLVSCVHRSFDISKKEGKRKTSHYIAKIHRPNALMLPLTGIRFLAVEREIIDRRRTSASATESGERKRKNNLPPLFGVDLLSLLLLFPRSSISYICV